ncbi:amino acid adenylation domain-containing protein, partial [uncultured Shewanella sp.]|uniref:non-ribosomal peptide synthetase n=1 Tax=uncultured Shewanella sp. TaxID=173975 RepID=UPI00260E6170
EPRSEIGKIDLLSDEERHTLLHEWNDTDAPYPHDKTLQQLFEAQVEKTPDNIALVFNNNQFENEQLTYAELNARANQLAHHIRIQYQEAHQQPLAPDTLIALYLDRSLEMVIGILAVLKAGGAYVPISPEYPQERVGFMLSDTQAPILLTQHHHADKLKHWQSELKAEVMLTVVDDVAIQQQFDGVGCGHPSDNLTPISSSTDLAYVIYTSGTTGQPKGAKISHMSLNNLCVNVIDTFNLCVKSRVLQFASFSFDAAVWEVFPSLVSGSSLYLIADEMKNNTDDFIKYLNRQEISIATIPPVFLEGLPYTYLPHLTTLVVAGERCKQATMNLWCKGRKLINAYGPTEGTVCATLHEYTEGDSNTSIGKPLDNIRCYVLDSHFHLTAVSIVGELYIGGAGLARGYLNQEALTAERFIDNPFATQSDIEKGYTRLYKTGDLVRYLPDGNLEYLGRLDNQVKIRGHRIELGEVEAALSQIKGVKQAVVIDRQHANSQDGNYH